MTDSQSARARPVLDRRQQLLDAARARFVRDGYAQTPVSAIVADAGVAQGTFYLYFKSKQAVLTELRREVFRDYEHTLVSTASAGVPADERLVRIVAGMADGVARHRDLERVFRSAETAEATERAALEGRARLATHAAGLLTEGVSDGTFATDDPELTAQLVVTLFDNILYEALTYQRPAPVGPLVRHATRFVLRAVGVAEARIAELVPPLSTST